MRIRKWLRHHMMALIVWNTATFCNAAYADNHAELRSETLAGAGFVLIEEWMIDRTGKLLPPRNIGDGDGVYAFAVDQKIKYIGVATKSLKKRLYLYAKPGKSQSTNIKINKKIRSILAEGGSVEIYTASPPDLSWNGFSIDGDVGLELWLIEKYSPEWNDRGAER